MEEKVYETMTIQEFVKTFRPNFKNLTEFANALKVSQSTISKYKNGQLQPNKKTAYRIFRDFDVIITPYSKEGLIEFGFKVLQFKRVRSVKTNEG